jgi:hypothetical protein
MRWNHLTVVTLVAGCASVRSYQPARFDDAELSTELRADAPRIRMVLSNHSDAPVDVRWRELSMVGPDHRQVGLAVPNDPGAVAPGASVEVRLELPSAPRPGAQLDLIVPTVVRGVPREYHYRVRARRKRS